MKLEEESNPNPDETATSERVYALDALHGIMMLLGIVLHSALTAS